MQSRVNTKLLCEQTYGHGAHRHPNVFIRNFQRWWQKLLTPKLGKSAVPFDWVNDVTMIAIRYSKFSVPIKNQFQSFSCSGQASSYLIAILNAIQSGTYNEISAKSIYAPIAYPGGGTTEPALDNRLCFSGANLESDVPSYEEGTTTEAWMTSMAYLIPALTQKALENAGYVKVGVPMDINSIAEAIRDYGVVMWEIEGQNGNYPGWLSSTPMPPVKSNPAEIWAHFMCVPLVDTSQGQNLKSLNSWGNTIGLGGYQLFGNTYINSGYIINCFTYVKPGQATPSGQVPQIQYSMLQLLQMWVAKYL